MNKLGFWEQSGRTPIAAAIVTTTLITAAYTFAGGLIANGIMLFDLVITAAQTGNLPVFMSGDYLESVKMIYDRYRVMILVLTTAMQFGIFLGCTAWIFRKWHGLPIGSYFKLQPPSPAALLLPLLGLVAIFPLAIFLGELSVRAFPFLKELEDVGSVLVRASNPVEMILIIGVIGLTPAICEEFLFRGYFQTTLSRGMRQPWSYVLSGTLFALIHQNYFGLGTLILVGIFLGFVFTRFQSIWAGAIVHFCYNTTLVIMANNPQWFEWMFDLVGFVRWEVLVFGIIATPLAVLGILQATKDRSVGNPTAAQTD